MRRLIASLALFGGGTLLVAGCTSSGAAAPRFEPSQGGGFPSEGPGVRISPIVPEPSGAGGGSGGSSAGRNPTSGPSGTPSTGGQGAKTDPQVVATRLVAPVGITVLPDNTALVGERTTGRIVRVQPVAGRPVPTVRTLGGLDHSGDGGLLDLAVSPQYTQDGLVYAYVTTATDNRVVEFTLHGPVTPVLSGIPRGTTGNAGRIAFGADGDLYVATGDAGHPRAADDPKSLAGKVLRVDAIGGVPDGNPRRGSPVFTSGHQGPSAVCPLPQAAGALEVEPGSTGGEVNQLEAGANYGWPTAIGGDVGALATLPASTRAPGDCVVESGRVWVTSPAGREIVSAPLTPGAAGLSVGAFGPTLARKYGRLESITAAADGALWLTTTNRDGHGTPVAADERVIRFLPSAAQSGGNSSA